MNAYLGIVECLGVSTILGRTFLFNRKKRTKTSDPFSFFIHLNSGSISIVYLFIKLVTIEFLLF